MTDISKLTARITAFLAQGKTPSDGGFAAVTTDELEELNGIIGDLIAAKYAVDPDGDLPVEFQLTDRTRYERPFNVVIPYSHKPYANYSEQELNLFIADRYQTLANYGAERASRHLRIAMTELRDAAQANRPLSFAGVPYIVALPKGLTLERIKETLDKVVLDAMQASPCPAEFRIRHEWADACAATGKQLLGINVAARTCSVSPEGVKLYFDIPALDTSVKVVVPVTP